MRKIKTNPGISRMSKVSVVHTVGGFICGIVGVYYPHMLAVCVNTNPPE